MLLNTLFKRCVQVVSLLFWSGLALAESKYNMPVGVTPISHDVYWLHMTVFWICVGIGVIVFSVLIYSLIMHRKSRGVQPAEFHEHPGLEFAWTIIPFIILVLMAIPATKVLMGMLDTRDSEVTVKITGYQWKWRYEYLDQGINFYSNISTTQDQIHNLAEKTPTYLLEVDHPLVLPVQRKIRFLVTANDVIHSWWVPELGMKTDAIPGFIHDSWAYIEKPGIYRGQCAELCGVNHGFMPIVVVALNEADFNKWLQQNGKAPLPPLKKNEKLALNALQSTQMVNNPTNVMERGKQIYEMSCVACHQSDGSGMPPTFPPLKGGKIATGPMAKDISLVLHGVPGTAMQAFGSQLSDEDIAAVITYTRNSFGNNDQTKYGKDAGGTVKPSDVAVARKQGGE